MKQYRQFRRNFKNRSIFVAKGQTKIHFMKPTNAQEEYIGFSFLFFRSISTIRNWTSVYRLDREIARSWPKKLLVSRCFDLPFNLFILFAKWPKHLEGKTIATTYIVKSHGIVQRNSNAIKYNIIKSINNCIQINVPIRSIDIW